MDRFKFEALLKEFPFIKEILQENERFSYKLVNSIKIKRVDTNLLSRTLEEFHHGGSMGESTYLENAWIIINDELTSLPVEHNYHESSNYAHSSTDKSEGRPIIEALVEFKDASTIILSTREYDNWEGGEIVDFFGLEIYKPSRNTTIPEEIEKARRLAVSKTKAEIDF